MEPSTEFDRSIAHEIKELVRELNRRVMDAAHHGLVVEFEAIDARAYSSDVASQKLSVKIARPL